MVEFTKKIKYLYRRYRAKKAARRVKYIIKYLSPFPLNDIDTDIEYITNNRYIEVRPEGKGSDAVLRVYEEYDGELEVVKYERGEWEQELKDSYREAKRIVKERKKEYRKEKRENKYESVGLK